MLTTSLKFLNNHTQTFNNDGEDVIEGLTKTPKSLPPKYFYDDRGSELFERICELPEYYPTRTEALILRQCDDEIAQITGACELVELGSGSSTKTRFLLDAYQKMPGNCKYVPIDVSGGILKISALVHFPYKSHYIQYISKTKILRISGASLLAQLRSKNSDKYSM